MAFFCDSCRSSIPANQPRVHCKTCADYDLCASCALGERFTGPHTSSHHIEIFKLSGDTTTRPVLSQTATITYSGVKASPPPLPPRPAGLGARSPTSPRVQSQIDHPPGSTGWAPFFNPDLSPTPTFVLLMESIFQYLDPHRTGSLVPEMYSKFLDDQGCVGQENTWKNSLSTPSVGQSHEDFADVALKRAYDLFSIEHNLKPRVQAPNQDSSGFSALYKQVLGSAYNPSMLGSPLASAGMPILTLKGFIDITTLEVLSDPSRHWGNLSRVMRMYNLPALSGWGDMPRSVLPEFPDERIVQRISQVAAYSAAQGQRELDATKVRLELEAQGMQNAIELVGNTRYIYTYT